MSVVYFIRSGATGAIKIGVTDSIKRRLTSLRNGNPSYLSVLATIPGGYEEERRLHTLFAPLRLVREWFSPDQPLLDFISGIGSVRVSTLEEQAAIDVARWMEAEKLAAKERLGQIDGAIRHGLRLLIDRDGCAAVCSRYGCEVTTVRRWRRGACFPTTAIGLTIIFDNPDVFEQLWSVTGLRPEAIDGLRQRMAVKAVRP